MSFGSTKNKLPDEPRLFGAETARVSTNEAARVLPWFAGSRWLGVTWIGDVFGVRTTPIVQKVGKKKQTTGYIYYASFAALIGGGRGDWITEIKFDDETVWEGDVYYSAADYVDITLTTRGIIRLYWGTETQVLDPILEASGQQHSGYRGQIYIVGNDILLGPDRTNLPNIQVKMSRWPRPPFLSEAQAILGGFVAGVDSNPVAVLWDWWTDARFGLGRTLAELDVARLTTAAEQLRVENIGVSPLITSHDDFKASLIRLLEHVDGYPTTYDGLFGIELARNTDESVPRITDSGFIGDPELDAETWDDTHDQVRVKFKNGALDGMDDHAKDHDLANYAITQRHKPMVVERPWVVRASVAMKIAAALLRQVAQPNIKGSAVLRESEADSASIGVGSVFEYETRDGSVLRFRCKERTEPEPGRRNVSITFETDRGWSNDEYYLPTSDPVPAPPTFEPEPTVNKIYDAPYALIQQDRSALLYMIARGDTRSTDYETWRSTAQDGDYSPANEHRAGNLFRYFAVKATLSADYTDDTALIDEDVGIAFNVVSEDDELLDDEWALADALEHRLLCFFGPQAMEIGALFDLVSLGAGAYTAKISRALYDTRRRAWEAGTEIWMQLRERIEADAWPPYSSLTRYFKFQPYFAGSALELAGIDPVEHNENARALKPIAPRNVAGNGDFDNATWNDGSDLTITWTNTSRASTLFGSPFGEAYPTDLTGVLFEFLDYEGEVSVLELEVDADESHVLTDAYMDSILNLMHLGGGGRFQLRVHGLRNGLRSLDYTKLLVTKV